MLLALVPIMFTYSGWNAAVYVAEEVRNPGRNVPLALGLGTLTVIVIYVALNALYLHVLGVAALGGIARPFARRRRRAAVRCDGGECDRRVHDRELERQHQRDDAGRAARLLRDGAGRVIPRCGRARAPAISTLRRSPFSRKRCGAIVLVLCGTLSQLVSYTGFAVVLFSAVAVASLFVLRRRDPDAPRPFRAWGYPWAPAIFVIACSAMVVNEMFRNGATALAGVAVIVTGIPVYFIFRAKQNRLSS